MLGIPFLSDALGKWLKPQTFDDPIDRLNYFYTAFMLVFFSMMISAKQYVGSPIQCWVPMEFKGGWEQYTEDYCFIQNTYFLPFHKRVPDELEMRQEAEIGYYQWVPIVLCIQAMMFFLPNWLWKLLHKQSGLDLAIAIDDARKLRALSSSDRRADTTKLATYIEECLDYSSLSRAPKRFLCFRFGSSLGSYVAMLYMFTKFLYLVNIVGQFYMLNAFLGSDYTFWGFQVFNDLWHGREWMESGVFPRVTLCDFSVRRLANIHRYTVQCVLMINMFNEKIYLFVWFWFLMVAVSTVINFLYCLITLVPSSFREKSTMSLLKTIDEVDGSSSRQLKRRFIHYGLKPDGVLLLRFIEGHAGSMVARDLSAQLYIDFMERSFGRNGQRIPQIIKSDMEKGEKLGISHPDNHSGHSTKSTSPGMDDGFNEQLYEPHHKMMNGANMPLLPTAPGYPGPPPPKPKLV